MLDLLGAGINVITTVNIQRLESLADEVEQMTGIPVRERVPDRVVRKASQIELIDSSPQQPAPPDAPRQHLPHEQVPRPSHYFFRTDNLIALRELALRFVADESDEQLLGYLRQQPQVLRETTERIMAAITTAPGTDAVLRRAARIALRYKAELEVVHVIVDDTGLSGERQPIDGLRVLAA